MIKIKICKECGKQLPDNKFKQNRNICVECKRKQDREYYRKNKDKKYKYYKKNKTKYIFNNHIRKLKKIENHNIELKYIDWEFLLSHYDNKCIYCGKDLNDSKSLDHYTPVSKGGDTTLINVVSSCIECNTRKNTNDGEEYFQSGKLKQIYNEKNEDLRLADLCNFDVDIQERVKLYYDNKISEITDDNEYNIKHIETAIKYLKHKGVI